MSAPLLGDWHPYTTSSYGVVYISAIYPTQVMSGL